MKFGTAYINACIPTNANFFSTISDAGILQEAVSSLSSYHLEKTRSNQSKDATQKPQEKLTPKSQVPVHQSHYAFYSSGGSSKAVTQQVDHSKGKHRSILDGFIDHQPGYEEEDAYENERQIGHSQIAKIKTHASDLGGKRLEDVTNFSKGYRSAFNAVSSNTDKYRVFNQHGDKQKMAVKGKNDHLRQGQGQGYEDEAVVKERYKHFGNRNSDEISFEDENTSSYRGGKNLKDEGQNDTDFIKTSKLRTITKQDHLEPSHNTNYQMSSEINFTTPASNQAALTSKRHAQPTNAGLNQTPTAINKPFDLGSARQRLQTHNLGSLLPQSARGRQKETPRRTPVAYEYTEDSRAHNWNLNKQDCHDADIDRILAKVKRAQNSHAEPVETASRNHITYQRNLRDGVSQAQQSNLQHMNQNMLSKYAGKPAAVNLTAFGRNSRLTN